MNDTIVFKNGLRYCSSLENLTILFPPALPEVTHENWEDEPNQWAMYAVLTDLRWLPRKCKVDFAGAVSEEVQLGLEEHEHARRALDDVGLPYPFRVAMGKNLHFGLEGNNVLTANTDCIHQPPV